jgi:uncharacterized protein with GYD domain
MSTFVMLTRLDAEAVRTPKTVEVLEQQAMRRVRKECPKVEWVGSYAALGPYDYVDIFRAIDIETATKVSALIRSFGHAHTEIWPVTEWARFKEMMRTLPAEA